MDKANRYLEILKINKLKYYQSKRNCIVNYKFLRLQTFHQKLNKAKLIFKKKFINEIKEIMFGNGDSKSPDKNAMEFIENLIVKFVSFTVIKVNFISFLKLSKRPVFQDILFIIRKNPFKTKRIIYLIRMKEIIENLVKQTKNANQIPKEIISKCKKFF